MALNSKDREDLKGPSSSILNVSYSFLQQLGSSDVLGTGTRKALCVSPRYLAVVPKAVLTEPLDWHQLFWVFVRAEGVYQRCEKRRKVLMVNRAVQTEGAPRSS